MPPRSRFRRVDLPGIPNKEATRFSHSCSAPVADSSVPVLEVLTSYRHRALPPAGTNPRAAGPGWLWHRWFGRPGFCPTHDISFGAAQHVAHPEAVSPHPDDVGFDGSHVHVSDVGVPIALPYVHYVTGTQLAPVRNFATKGHDVSVGCIVRG
jgi:hypothetical protein